MKDAQIVKKIKKKKKKRNVFCLLFVRIKREQNWKESIIGRMNRCKSDANVVFIFVVTF